jgi:hypothetical protein
VISENEAKKNRAEKRATEESRATVQKIGEIEDHAAQFDVLRVVGLNFVRPARYLRTPQLLDCTVVQEAESLQVSARRLERYYNYMQVCGFFHADIRESIRSLTLTRAFLYLLPGLSNDTPGGICRGEPSAFSQFKRSGLI